MVSKSVLALLELTCIEEYFEYIIDSKENGQHDQAIALYHQLSEGQRTDFFDWVGTTYYYEAEDNGIQIITEIKNLKNYLECRPSN